MRGEALRRAARAALLLLLAAALAPPAAAESPRLRLIGQQLLPAGLLFEGSRVGGLSGIDYDARLDRFVLISDDRSAADGAAPARVYFARLDFDAQAFRALQITGMQWLLQADGRPYPKLPAAHAPDPEGLRVDPLTGHWVWVSEGDRASGLDPWVRESGSDGRTRRDYRLPAVFSVQQPGRGPRANAAFEGLAFSPDGQQLAVLMEGPLLEDGEPPTLAQGSISRLTLFDRASGLPTRQLLYPIDAVRHAARPAGGFQINGPTEILALDAQRFWVLERSFSVGVPGHAVRLYEVDTEGASDVLDAPLSGAVPLRKRLILDFDTLRPQLGSIANLEGMSWGPRLPDGRRSLVLIADDNFAAPGSDTDRGQCLVFEVLESNE